MLAILSVTVSSAKSEVLADNMSAYDMTVNFRSLSRYLELSAQQEEVMELIHEYFCRDMRVAARKHDDERSLKTTKAINRNLSYVHSYLDAKQYHKYVTLLNVTLNNRGIKI